MNYSRRTTHVRQSQDNGVGVKVFPCIREIHVICHVSNNLLHQVCVISKCIN